MIPHALLVGVSLLFHPLTDTTATAPVDSALPSVAPLGRDTTAPHVDSSAIVPLPSVHESIREREAEDYRPGPVDFITNLPGDWVDWTTENVTVENVPIIAGITAATVALVLIDEEGYHVLRDPYLRSPDFQKASDMAVFIGDGKFQFGIACLFGAYGFIADDARAIRTASQTAEVILACGGVVQVLKHLTGRESPFVATSPTGRWALFPDQIAYHNHVPHYDAFPSGHVATGLATLTVIMENYPEATWLPWVGYPAIGALAVGMVGAGIHWWSDYPLAIALGYTFGKLVGSRRSDDRQGAGRTSIAPDRAPYLGLSMLSDGSPAVGIAWSW